MILKTLLSLMAFQYIGTPYIWAGNNYDGLDCSGLVLKSLHDVGVTLPDMTAQTIYNWALSKKFESCEPSADCLLFFGGSDKHLTHVAIALDEKYMIEAAGAGRNSLTMSKKDLARIDARVRIKPITNRGDLIASIKIKY